MKKEVIHTNNAPNAIGAYSQAIALTQPTQTIYLSGQIPLVPETMTIVSDKITEQTHQMFKNLSAVCQASGGSLNDIVKLNIYLTDLANFALVNEVMAEYFTQPYPARAALGINALPKESLIEADGIMCL